MQKDKYKKKLNSYTESENEDWYCLECGGPYSKSEEDSIQCIAC